MARAPHSGKDPEGLPQLPLQKRLCSEEECEKARFDACLAATMSQTVVDRNALGELCVDEILASLLYTRICRITKPMSAYFTSTIDSRNRVEDATGVLQKVGLQEQGRGDVVVLLDDGKGTIVSSCYRRIVYGDHGPHIELERGKIQWDNFPIYNKKSRRSYYDESYTCDKQFMLYEQMRSVQNVANPPRTGKRRVRSNRPEGYADYAPGMCYLPALSVMWQKQIENALVAQTVKITRPSSYLNVGLPSPSGNGGEKVCITDGQKTEDAMEGKVAC